MNNFGVIEIASTRTTNAPGWAYVPDTGRHTSSAAALQPANRKRARNHANLSYADVDARQEAKIRKELEILDRDAHRDVNIPIPPKPGGGAGGGGGSSRAHHKHTPNVRKILQSQKTFANHLDDFKAMLAHAEANPHAAAAGAAGGGGGGASHASRSGTTAPAHHSRRASHKRHEPAPSRGTPKAASTPAPAPAPVVVKQEDIEMRDADAAGPSSSAAPLHPQSGTGTRSGSTILQPSSNPPPPPHPSDADPLLASRVPPLPSDAELRALLAAPPLSYVEAQAGWTDEDRKYPARVFCEVCGYWGRVKCMKCGVRVCALDCLETHREECVTRYGL